MAKFSTGLRNGMLSGLNLKAALNGGSLLLFSGPVPATADAAETGTVLMSLTVGGNGTTGLSFGTAENGVISKSETEVWATSAVDTSGTISYFRFVSSTDSGGDSTTEARIQGTAGIVGTDLVLTSTEVTAGQPWTLNYFNVALPTLV